MDHGSAVYSPALGSDALLLVIICLLRCLEEAPPRHQSLIVSKLCMFLEALVFLSMSQKFF
jgi:hypothetical protein